MPEVSLQLEIRAPADRVWETVIDVERYPATMDSVRWVRIEDDRDDGHRSTAWSVVLKGSILEWREREHLDRDGLTMTFSQLTGDLERFDGAWRLEPLDDDRTRVSFAVSFEIGIPLLADMLNPVAQRSLHDNCREMLLGVERQSTTA